MNYAMGIDIGGTTTRVALYDEQFKVYKRIQFPTITEDPIVNCKKIKEVMDFFKILPVGCGVSCPGPLDLLNGFVLTPPNLPLWHHFPIQKVLQEILQIPVVLENDANLACLGEAVMGAGKDKKFVQFLTISTGVGSGFVVDKQIYQGAHGFAHEIANMIMWQNGPIQGDLKEGSIEAIASGTAIVKRATDAGLMVSHAGEVHELSQQGNRIACTIMEEAKEYLANTIAALFGILDPDIIILGGSVALKIDGFIEDVEQRVKQKVYPDLVPFVSIVKAKHDEDSGLIGAAYTAFHYKAL